MTTQSEDFDQSKFDRVIKDSEKNSAFSIQTKTGEILEILPTYEEALEVKKEIESNPELESVDIVEIER